MRCLMSLAVLATLFALPAVAADFKCNNGRVEKSGSTQYTYKESSSEIVIEKGGSSWATASDAQRTYDCNADVAATLWVLSQKGAL